MIAIVIVFALFFSPKLVPEPQQTTPTADQNPTSKSALTQKANKHPLTKTQQTKRGLSSLFFGDGWVDYGLEKLGTTARYSKMRHPAETNPTYTHNPNTPHPRHPQPHKTKNTN